MLYGIACGAIAWIFMIEGCRRSKYAFIFLSYLFLVFSLFYKAHVFVANAFLILMYPCIFFSAVKPRIRFALGVFAVALFIAVIMLSQATGKVPLLRLDFSSTGRYARDLLNDFDYGVFRDFYSNIFRVDQPAKIVQGLVAVGMILLSTFGAWLVAFAMTAFAARKQVIPVAFWFPVVVLVNYIVMATGLAYDTRGIGSRDEMMNRPLVWAHYVIAAWSTGVGYYLLFGNSPPATTRGRIGVAVVVIMALMVPLAFHKNLQTFPVWKMANYADFNAAPACLVKAAKFIRENSAPGDIIQDSGNDPKFIVTALAERQSYVSAGPFGPAFKPVKDRVASLNTFMAMHDAAEIRRFVVEKQINWILLRPENRVAWPHDVMQSVRFECGQYKVLHFPRA
jgi:hypothetical protein